MGGNMRIKSKKVFLDLLGFILIVLTSVVFALWILHTLATQGGI